MPAITDTLFDGVYAGLPEARVQLRAGRDATITRALCPRSGSARAYTEQGVVPGAVIDVRWKVSEEPAGDKFENGAVVELLPYGATEWITLRISERHMSGTIVHVILEAHYA